MYDSYGAWSLHTPWLLLLVVLLIVASELWRRNRDLPPGPWGLPLFGYYPFLGAKAHVKLGKMASKYGDVMSFRTVGGELIVLLNRLPVLKEVLVARSDEFTGRPWQSNLLSWVDYGLGVTQTEGSVWKEQRRYFLQTAKFYGFGKMECEPLIHEEMQSLLEAFRSYGSSQPFDPISEVSHFTANIIASILFQKKFRRGDPYFEKLASGLHDLIQIFADGRTFFVGPLFEHGLMKLVPSGRAVARTRDLMHSEARAVIEEHVKTFDESNLRDYVDAYLNHLKKLEGKKELSTSSFSIDRLAAISLNMMMEGTDSMSTSICTLLRELALHQAEQKLAQAELDSVVGRDRLPSWMDRQELPYTEALIQELFRVRLPFNFSTHYSNFEETTLQGYRIPKRSIIIANYWTISNDPEQFPNPERFDPGRFLGPDGKPNKQEGPTPYGIGKRVCIGESLARMEVFVSVASVLQNFVLLPGPTEGLIKAVPRET